MDGCGEWKVSPAYDLTFSSGPGGEQSTMVMGEGKAPGLNDLRKLGEEAGLKRTEYDRIIDQTRDALSNWTKLAKRYAVTERNIRLISKLRV